MYIDNNSQSPFATPNTGFATPSTGFQQPMAQSPFMAAQPAPAPAAPVELPDGFIEGWDELENYDFSQNAVQIKVFGVERSNSAFLS